MLQEILKFGKMFTKRLKVFPSYKSWGFFFRARLIFLAGFAMTMKHILQEFSSFDKCTHPKLEPIRKSVH